MYPHCFTLSTTIHSFRTRNMLRGGAGGAVGAAPGAGPPASFVAPVWDVPKGIRDKLNYYKKEKGMAALKKSMTKDDLAAAGAPKQKQESGARCVILEDKDGQPLSARQVREIRATCRALFNQMAVEMRGMMPASYQAHMPHNYQEHFIAVVEEKHEPMRWCEDHYKTVQTLTYTYTGWHSKRKDALEFDSNIESAGNKRPADGEPSEQPAAKKTNTGPGKQPGIRGIVPVQRPDPL